MQFEELVFTIQQTHDTLQESAVKAINKHLTIRNWLIACSCSMLALAQSLVNLTSCCQVCAAGERFNATPLSFASPDAFCCLYILEFTYK